MSAAVKHHHRNMKSGSHKNQRQQRVLLGFGIAVVVLVVGILLLSTGAGGGVPNFTANTLTGETVRLSDYQGQVVMLNFWATWCPPCRAEMPTIQAAYDRYHDQGFAVLAINNAEPADQIQPFASALDLQFPIVLDTRAELQETFGINGYPTSLFIAPDGEIYRTHNGMLTDQQLEAYIAVGLAKLKPKAEA
ncbi:MAG: TlpA family protein disulfide reductase [Anaerolineae bacterium]|nr:TlpA family protein disulfide reductase [Anaerolineae bacterium]